MNTDLSVSTTQGYSLNTNQQREQSKSSEVGALDNSNNTNRVSEEVNKLAVTEDMGMSDKQPESIKDKQQAKFEREQLEVMAQKLQEFVGTLNRGLEFSVDEDSGRDVIKVIDRDSKEVVRQYPSEEVLDLIANLSDAAGNFINSKA